MPFFQRYFTNLATEANPRIIHNQSYRATKQALRLVCQHCHLFSIAHVTCIGYRVRIQAAQHGRCFFGTFNTNVYTHNGTTSTPNFIGKAATNTTASSSHNRRRTL